jgi:hypothetical protein
MSRQGESEDPRRRMLIQLLAAGALTGASASALAQLFGGRPTKLAAGRSIYRLDGQVTVDGKPATVDTKIGGRATIETGRNAEVVYAVGESAFIMRGNSKVTLETAQPDSVALTGLRLLSGKLLSVFAARKPMQLKAATATIGIRGTGIYMEADPEQTYFCTCYGVADVKANGDPESEETVAATITPTRNCSSLRRSSAASLRSSSRRRTTRARVAATSPARNPRKWKGRAAGRALSLWPAPRSLLRRARQDPVEE